MGRLLIDSVNQLVGVEHVPRGIAAAGQRDLMHLLG
jgi:hypothetical protein